LVAQEAQWLNQAQQGDPDAFSMLVEIYQRPVFNLCYRMLGDRNEAEDAAQETFLRAFKAIERYDPKRSFATWVLTIASRYCIDVHRRRRLPTLSIEAMPRQDIPDHALGPEAKLGMNEEERQIQKMLNSLSPIDRAAIIMRYWHEMSYEEIGQSLTLSVSAIKSRLHRARKELATKWQEQQTRLVNFERTQHESPAF
jgi:RNA polymerase sigma-70 factor (ECF subfamily)